MADFEEQVCEGFWSARLGHLVAQGPWEELCPLGMHLEYSSIH
jgi:hypothetical protein